MSFQLLRQQHSFLSLALKRGKKVSRYQRLRARKSNKFALLLLPSKSFNYRECNKKLVKRYQEKYRKKNEKKSDIDILLEKCKI